MKKTKAIGKIALYQLVIWGNLGLYVAWKSKILPLNFQKFMSNYGLHAAGNLGAVVLYIFIAAIFSMLEESSKRTFIGKCTMFITCFMFFGIGIEALQIFDPKRVFDWWDIIAQIVGCLIGYSFVFTLGQIHWPIKNRSLTE